MFLRKKFVILFIKVATRLKVINGLTSFEEVLRVIDIEDDLGEEQKELKNALIGKKEHKENMETLDLE